MTVPGFAMLEWPWGESKVGSDLVKNGEVLGDGFLRIRPGPGLGIEPDEEVVSEQQYWRTALRASTADCLRDQSL